ncbi:MBL fold metallo-hydrolase [Fluviispira sanaruensis]|uniref:MBL fold metallo-hydrolase n=1 Tax=Fluviispira sanaruensis TaxID=2493639 RepID=A0A4P2VJZ3_FLUSA|nr:MBL fold metallo-hydrolase [Fluviispira sanaruensis]BBH52878.1 MBL fold metallo-hydrolase [Fluviispira sanaruensis]
MNFRKQLFGIVTFACTFFSLLAGAATLEIKPYNPVFDRKDKKIKPIFPVASVLITGKKDAVLIDAQFQKAFATDLVKMIKDSKKNLTTVFVTHKDPDFYFGLDTIKKEFPNVKILATKYTVNDIKASMDGKLKYWSPILKDQAPAKVILPEVLDGNSIMLEGEKIEVIGLDSAAPGDTFLWLPSNKTAVGGVIVYGNMHLWVADNQSEESRKHWFEAMDAMENLKPTKVIPGHYLSKPMKIESIKFTRDYLKKFEEEAKKAKDSKELIGSMKKLYPKIGGNTELEMSAKVIKGEMKWPM